MNSIFNLILIEFGNQVGNKFLKRHFKNVHKMYKNNKKKVQIKRFNIRLRRVICCNCRQAFRKSKKVLERRKSIFRNLKLYLEFKLDVRLSAECLTKHLSRLGDSLDLETPVYPPQNMRMYYEGYIHT